MSDFAEAILREKPDLPVIRGDTSDTWIHGIGSMPIETQLAHTTRPRIAALEALDTLLRLRAHTSALAGIVVRDAYENTLLFGEHTWGPDVGRYAGYTYGDAWKQKRAAGDYRFLLEGFDQKRAYARKAAALVEPAREQRMTTLARAIGVAGKRIVVFNPLPWERDGVVDVPWDGPLPSLSVDGPKEREVLAAAVDKGRLRFVARGLPPLDYATYVPGRSKVSDCDLASDDKVESIENKFFRVTLDAARCGIRSILDKRTGRELVNLRSPYALGQYFYERFDADGAARFTKAYVLSPDSGENISHGKPNLPPASQVPYCSATARDAALAIYRNEVSVSAVLKARPLGIVRDATQLRVTLDRECPWVDLEWSIVGKTPDPWPEAGWLCFPLRSEDPSFRLARLGSIVDPAKDLVRGSNHEVFCLNSGLMTTGADGGRIGICPIDSQLVSLEHPGLWRYSRDFVAHKPDVFVNLFNNVYSTNFAQWNDGSWSSRVRIWVPQAGEPTDESLIGSSWEARNACLATASDTPKGGPLPRAESALRIRFPGSSRRGLLVTAFGPNPYGEGTLLRLWEQTGSGGTCEVVFPGPMRFATAQPCDLRGEPTGEPKRISQQTGLQATIRPMAPMSFILLPTKPI
jgi:alpha-mannosidase